MFSRVVSMFRALGYHLKKFGSQLERRFDNIAKIANNHPQWLKIPWGGSTYLVNAIEALSIQSMRYNILLSF